jgi:hypothetical protein
MDSLAGSRADCKIAREWRFCEQTFANLAGSWKL